MEGHMNKKYITIGIIGLLIISAFSISQYLSMKTEYDDIEANLATSKREISELKTMLTVNDTAVKNNDDELETHLQNYETLLRKLTSYNFNNRYQNEMIKHAYDISATIHTDDSSFPLPRNGIVNIDSEEVELEIKFSPPPELRDETLNRILHQFDSITNDVTFDSYSGNIEHFQDENTIRIKYTDLKYGNRNHVFIRNELYQLLSLQYTDIVITRTDEYLEAKDYLPMDIASKTFAADGNNLRYLHEYEYLDDSTWTVTLTDPVYKYEYNLADKAKFYFDGELKVLGISHNENRFVEYEQLVLPKEIRLGESWDYPENTAMITAIHFPLDTVYGTLDTIEVTHTDEENRTLYKAYYAKGLGLVYRDFGGGGYTLKNIEYLK